MNVSELMKRPYHVVLVRDEAADGQVGWVASVAELPGCLSQGDTPAEAAEHIQDAMESWLQMSLDYGDPIPEPFEPEYPHNTLRASRALDGHPSPDGENVRLQGRLESVRRDEALAHHV